MQSVVLPCFSFLCSYCLFSQSKCRLLCSGVNKFSQMPSKTSENKTVCVCVSETISVSPETVQPYQQPGDIYKGKFLLSGSEGKERARRDPGAGGNHLDWTAGV